MAALGLQCCALAVFSLGAQASHCGGFSCIGSRCMGFSLCSMQAQMLQLVGLAALWHVGSSQTRDQASVPCIGRQILNHWPTQKVLNYSRFL